MNVSRRWVSLLLVGLWVVLGAGCGEPGLSAGEGGGDGTGPRASDRYFMVPAGESRLWGEVTGAVEVKIYLYDRFSGEPAGQQQVAFEVLGDEATRPQLQARSSMTDESGAAMVQAYFGVEPGQWTVRVDHEYANAVEFSLESTPVASGGLQVRVENSAPTIMRLGNIDVRVYRQDVLNCDYFNPYGQQGITPLVEGQVDFEGESISFDGLGTRHPYVVTAVARGERGQIAAGGCVNQVNVSADTVTDVEVLLQLVPLIPVGRYDVVSFWDFTEAIAESGSVGSVIMRVLNVFDNPGQAIYDEIIALIRSLVGGLISGTVDTFLDLTNLDQAFQNMINTFIEDNAVLRQIRDAGRDLRDVVANLQVHSELSIGKLNSNFEFRGQDNWTGLTLYWRWDCADNAPADCGAIELVPDADGQFAGLGLLSSNWTGQVVAYDQLQINRHPVSLRYGRLIIYVLNDVILPRLTDGNAHSMSEAFAYWIGCDGLAASIIPDGEVCVLGYCLQESTVANFCDSAVSTIFSFADVMISGLEFDMGLQLGGEGKLIEETSDGMVDRIEDGLFEGVVQSSDGGQSSPFTATFTGEVRVGN
ncbi:hypothetical protein DL240_05015 [Lujinxingia litoralis]|uniref:Big-1 domain-containing protein n=1 Tax=Lujinxingia litoralis TaxID=2211119 RepID=A0A328C951_9DELT|nr:hypothetical protein [Lujinxingia litoralis]RAL23524.1 hypothetical protein DL240_05015 [Lujinxingia litoralis]